MEMTRGGKPGKPKAGFPRFSTRLEIAFAIPTFPQVSASFSFFQPPEADGIAPWRALSDGVWDLARLVSAGL